MKSDGLGCVKSGGPQFISVTAREGEWIVDEQGTRPRAEEQHGEVTRMQARSWPGLASEKQISISFSGSQARASKVVWLGLA